MHPSLSLSGRIVAADIVRRPIPLRRLLSGPKGLITTRSIRLLHLKAHDGCEGIGEGSSVEWLSADASPTVPAAFRYVADYIRREKPPAEELLEWSLKNEGPSALRSALQTALLDVEARRREISMARLLGAPSDGPPLAVSALIADDDPEAMARLAAALKLRGIDSFKVKTGRREIDGDVARAMAVRDAIGSTARLRLDANGAWRLDEATRALAALEGAAAEFVEEPLADPGARTHLRSSCPVALDESVSDVAGLDDALALGGFAVLVLKLERVGGPLPALELAGRAMRAGIEVVFTDSIESAVGRAATLHVASAACQQGGIAARAVGLGGLFLLDDPMDKSLLEGDLSPASVHGPGLGVDLARAQSGKST